MQNFTILYRRPDQGALTPPFAYQCTARNIDDAEDYCERAHPGCEIVWAWQGDHEIGLDAAYDDYYSV